MSYTKGPWVMTEGSTRAHVDSERGEIIADVWGINEGVDYAANARLIAAAPLLLEALKELVGAIEYYAGLKEREAPNVEDWAFVFSGSEMDKAREAIKKATGEQP